MSDYSLEGRMWKKLKPHLNMSTDKWQSCYETLIIEFWFALDLNIVFSLSPNTSLFSEPHSHFALILIKAARHRFLIQPAMWKLFSKITCRYPLNILTLNMIVHNSTVHLLRSDSPSLLSVWTRTQVRGDFLLRLQVLAISVNAVSRLNVSIKVFGASV